MQNGLESVGRTTVSERVSVYASEASLGHGQSRSKYDCAQCASKGTLGDYSRQALRLEQVESSRSFHRHSAPQWSSRKAKANGICFQMIFFQSFGRWMLAAFFSVLNHSQARSSASKRSLPLFCRPSTLTRITSAPTTAYRFAALHCRVNYFS